ncbi:hypothetical protein, partial [Burkholderia cenocepacia]|uniref:hypothetical protein n=1 Tax=Burkholderia cenocepacia TaxID=95486 RepID=UPI00223775AE
SYSGTAAAAGAVSDFRQNITLANIAAGDTLQGEALVEIDGGATNLRGVALRIVLFDSVGGSNTYESLSFSWSTLGDKLPARAFTGANVQFHRAMGLALPAGSLASGASGFFGIRTVWDAAVASSAVIRVRNLRLHKVLA